jgi:hypothetical protein
MNRIMNHSSRRISRKIVFPCSLAILLLLGSHSVSHAQLIGNRTVGNAPGNIQQTPPSGRLGAGSFTNMGANSGPMGAGGLNLGTTQGGIQTNGRFVRGNRARGDFVGTNRTELSGFVGAGQALGVGRVPSSVENLKVETRAARINRPLPAQPKKGLYYPRLEVDLSSRSTPEPIPATPAGLELQRRVLKFAGVDTSIQLLGRTAIIDASLLPVDSIELVKTLLSFEPGIDRIEIVNKQTTHE